MRLLLDTHAFVWWVADDPRLTKRARTAVSAGHETFVSVATFWEIAIKVSLGKLTIATPLDRFFPEQLTANTFDLLHIDLEHIGRVSRLPFHHRDPFDRLLAAQAVTEDLSIVSADPVFKRCGVARIW